MKISIREGEVFRAGDAEPAWAARVRGDRSVTPHDTVSGAYVITRGRMQVYVKPGAYLVPSVVDGREQVFAVAPEDFEEACEIVPADAVIDGRVR